MKNTAKNRKTMLKHLSIVLNHNLQNESFETIFWYYNNTNTLELLELNGIKPLKLYTFKQEFNFWARRNYTKIGLTTISLIIIGSIITMFSLI